jgi:transposase
LFRGFGTLGRDLSHAVSLEGEAVGVVDEAVEDGVGDGGVGDDLMPMLDRHLTGNDGRSALVAVIVDLMEIATLVAGERGETTVVEDEQVDPRQHLKEPCLVASEVAREAGIHTSELFRWRQQLCKRTLAPVAFNPVAVAPVQAGTSSTFTRPVAGASRHGRDRVCDRRPDADYRVGQCLDGVGADQGTGQDQAAPMIQVPNGVRVWLATGHTDMRKGFASLSLHVQEVLRRDPLCGHLFCFRGRRGNLLKVIWHDGQGACLFTKRLEQGRFLWPSPADGVVTISSAQLGYLLSGIDWRHPQETWRPTSVG